MTPATPMFSPQAMAAMRAQRLKEAGGRRQPGTKFVYDFDEVAAADRPTYDPAVQVLRETRVDTSAYQPSDIAAIGRQNGSGRGLRAIAERQARRATRHLGPAWMRFHPDPSSRPTQDPA